jgi:hypothetical protein
MKRAFASINRTTEAAGKKERLYCLLNFAGLDANRTNPDLFTRSVHHGMNPL